MMSKTFFSFVVATLLLVSCKKDDDRSIIVTGISLEPTTLTLVQGETETLTAIVQPIDATNQSITWTSENQEVATVDDEGHVTAITPGTALITATTREGGKTANCTVTVQPEITKLFKKQYMTIEVGNTITPSEFVHFNVAEANMTLVWHSDNEDVAVVEVDGIITGLSEGVATITCEAYNGIVRDTFRIAIVETGCFIEGAFTGILSYEDGETINATSKIEVLRVCSAGFYYGFCSYAISMSIAFDGKTMNIDFDDLFVTHENSAFLLFAETTFEGHPVIVNGTLIPYNSSLNLKICLARESPVKLIFQSSTKENYIEMTMTSESAITTYFQIGGTGKMTLNWGDGSETETYTLVWSNEDNFWGNTANQYSHRYTEASTCTITISGDDVTHFIYNSAPITHLDVSNNSRLRVLGCSNSELTHLNLSKNLWLSNLNCFNNKIENLDISNNKQLTYLSCDMNRITDLDISQNNLLTILFCASNQIKNLDISQAPIQILNCHQNQIDNLDLSNSIELVSLDCGRNQIANLDISKNYSLATLICDDNKITSLDVSNNSVLMYIGCQSNLLSTEALNSLFTTLPSRSEVNGIADIYIYYNPGADTCDRHLAEEKGWNIDRQVPTSTR